MIHILIRYLGIKTKLLPEIKEEIINETNENDIILDLFAGSNIVAESLMNDRVVYTNDIQQYSYISAIALLEKVSKKTLEEISLKKITNSSYYQENFNYLSGVLDVPLREERKLLLNCKREIENSTIEIKDKFNMLKEFHENEPYVGNFNNKLKCFLGLEYFYSIEHYEYLRKNKNEEYYSLFSMLFAMPYFSLNQAVFIDSYRFALDHLLLDKEINNKEYAIYLSVLIYLLQNIVTSIGDHFAQPQKLKLINESKYIKEIVKIINKRNLDIEECMDKKISEFNMSEAIEKDNKCFNMDVLDLLSNDAIMDKIQGIYIDPPYTNAHYSRFYHILETLVKYDYPEFSFNARYPVDRYQSDFCIKSKATKTFEEMISICSNKNKKLFISYSDTKQCMISRENLENICGKYYNNVKIIENEYLYRNLGQKPNKVKGNELLFICR